MIQKFVCWKAASVADATAVNTNGIKTFSPNGVNIFFIKGKPFSSNGPRSLPKNLLVWPILNNWVFDNSISADEPFAKVLRYLKTCVVVVFNHELVSSLESPTTFDERFKVTPILFVIIYILSCELDKFLFKVLHWVILY